MRTVKPFASRSVNPDRRAGSDRRENPAFPSLITCRLTLSALKRFAGGPPVPPAPRVSALCTPASKAVQESIVPPMLNKEPESFGRVPAVHGSQEAFCRTIGTLHANINDVVVDKAGAIAVLGFPYSRERHEDLPIIITAKDSLLVRYLFCMALRKGNSH